MISQSRKKHRTTALTFNRVTRTSRWLCAVTACIVASGTAMAVAEDAMRPVPRFTGTSIRDKRTDSQKAGAASGLQWRISSEVKQAVSPSPTSFPAVAEVQSSEPESPIATGPIEIALPAPVLPVNTVRSTIVPVMQAKYQNSPGTPRDDSGLVLPPGLQPAPQSPTNPGLSMPSGALPQNPAADSTKPLPDFFTDPFGDATPEAAAEASPMPSAPAPLEPNGLRLPTPQVIPVPEDTAPGADTRDSLPQLDEMPAPKPEKAPNPFDKTRSSDQPGMDDEDKRQLDEYNTPMRPKSKSNESSPYRGSTADPKQKTIEYSCDRFRSSIAATKIQDVSLDISPPFRPDVIELDKFQSLKTKFDESQQIRDWQSIDGRKLGRGRMRDLAYEKVVIETEFGTLEQLPVNRISEADLEYIGKNWGLPIECLIDQPTYVPRSWQASTITWKASNLCHKPLYFEEVNLERYGHDAGPFAQPIVSTAHFFVNIAVLPYKMGVHGPRECQYTLGYYRPGNCAPWIVPPVPLSLRGALYQAGAVAGAIVLYP